MQEPSAKIPKANQLKDLKDLQTIAQKEGSMLTVPQNVIDGKECLDLIACWVPLRLCSGHP